jgi:hypothetical protein
LFKDVYEKYNIPQNATVGVSFTQTNWKALEALKKAISWKKLNYKETYAIMKDISDNRFTDTLITYYSAIWFFKKASDYELVWNDKSYGWNRRNVAFWWVSCRQTLYVRSSRKWDNNDNDSIACISWYQNAKNIFQSNYISSSHMVNV